MDPDGIGVEIGADCRERRNYRLLRAAALGMALALIAGACSSDDSDAADTAEAVDVAGDGGADATEAAVVEERLPHIQLSEFAIQGDLTVAEGQVTLEVENHGAVPHNLRLVNGPITSDLNSGEVENLDLGELAPGTYEVLCEIPGHQAAGMEATLTVVPADEASSIETTGHSHGEDPDWEEPDRVMQESILAFPAETEGKGNQPLEPTIAPDGTKVFDLTVSIENWEVEPGKIVEAWTYNGQVPGPAINVNVGDRVRVNVQNDLPTGTDIHWHGISTPNNMDGVAPLTQPLIEAGQSYTYEFDAVRPSIGMYHAHHHAQMQIPNGLFGTFVIGDMPVPRGETIGGNTIPEDLEVALDIPMVLNDAGVIGYSLNGKSFPATEPYVVNKGDWVTVTYYNEGLQIHPMHLHQFPQLVIAKDGYALDYPYYADTINVAPGERFTVLVNFDEPGAWVWHCHILNHVESEEGMFGMVTAVIVQDS